MSFSLVLHLDQLITKTLVLLPKLALVKAEQLEVAEFNFRTIYEDNRSLSNNADTKNKFKISIWISISHRIL